MADFHEPAFPVTIQDRNGEDLSYPGLTKLQYATFEILKSPYSYQGRGDKGLIQDAIKLAKEALKQLAEEY